MIVDCLADDHGNTGINVQSTIHNCTSAPEPLSARRLRLRVGDSAVQVHYRRGRDTAGGSLTMFASPTAVRLS